MNSRFKFRVFDKPTGKMFYDVALGFIKAPLSGDWICADTPYGQISYTGKRLDDIELMQSTSLKDKNDKLIYEGDILSDATHKYIVEWSINNGYFIRKPWICDVFSYRIDPDTTKNTEVIGNIYENAELLEE